MKPEKNLDSLHVTPHATDESDENVSSVMKEIQTRLRDTEFKGGFRVITKAELQNDNIERGELDFRIIKTPEEATRVVRYEDLIEVQSAYLAVEAGMGLR